MLPQLVPLAGQPSVLVVEDEALIRAIVSDELRAAGLTVVEATNADEALSYLETRGMVDLIFTDIQMPGSINGLELARRLRTASPSLPILITSGNAGPEAVAGIGCFLPKPYDMNEVVQTIRSALGMAPMEQRT